MAISEKIFKAYDIRGKYSEEIDKQTAIAIGSALAVFWRGKTDKIIVGRDARVSSPELQEGLIDGILSQGMNVWDIGLCTTPLLIFATKMWGDFGGVMISASHSPPDINGFKIMGQGSVQMPEEKYEPIKKLALENNFAPADKKGNIFKKDILSDYVSHIAKYVGNIKGVKIAVDYGNGMGALTAKPVFEKIRVETFSLYEELDGSFPNHLPDPHDPKNMRELCELVKKEKADLGVFFDGDADRGIIIDEQGEIAPVDLLCAAFAQEELKKFPGGAIYYDLRFTRAMKDIVKQSGGEPHMMRVGNPYYKEKMAFENGVFAAELSGHIMFKENFGIDDGLFAAIMAMNLIKARNKKMSEIISGLRSYFATEEISLIVKDADAVTEKVKNKYSHGKFIDLDGIYIEFSDWWFNLRKSNTEPKVRLRIEADTKELMEEKKRELMELIND